MRKMHSVELGELGRHLVIVHAITLGFRPAIPVCENIPYDLILEKDGRCLRTQVKARMPKGGILEFKMMSYAGRGATGHIQYSSKNVDIIACVDLKSRKVYVIDMATGVFNGRNSLRLRLTETKNNQRNRVRLAQDFEWNNSTRL